MKKKEMKIDEWIEQGWDEIDFLNYVKPLVLSNIRAYILKVGKGSSPLEEYEDLIRSKPKSKKRDLYLEIISWLKEVRDKAKNGDKVSKMILVNHGFMKKVRKI